jgi:hypothetical protein
MIQCQFSTKSLDQGLGISRIVITLCNVFALGQESMLLVHCVTVQNTRQERATYFVAIALHGGQQFHIEVFFAIYIGSMQMRRTTFGNNNIKI